MNNKPVKFQDITIMPGERKAISIPLAAMPAHQDVEMTVHVINGKKSGPCLFVCAAIHGDEINGIEIIRRLLKQKQMQKLRGTLVAIPIVNMHGFITHSRYLPDGRDLNRSFPGSEKGSLASRIAYTFLKEIVKKCTHGIDLHTASRHRDNLPQIRADMSCENTKILAQSFGVPVILDSKVRDGSLRESVAEKGTPILLYEAGEALRFDEVSIKAGVRGTLNVMRELEMLPKLKNPHQHKLPVISTKSSWVRAASGGLLNSSVPLGARVAEGDVIGIVSDPTGSNETQVIAPKEGIVIGKTNLPLVYEGDALFHLAFYSQKTEAVSNQVEEFQEQYDY